MIRECDASFNLGIMFENWGHKNYLQNVPSYVAEHLGMSMVYGKLIGENVDPKEFVGEYIRIIQIVQ